MRVYVCGSAVCLMLQVADAPSAERFDGCGPASGWEPGGGAYVRLGARIPAREAQVARLRAEVHRLKAELMGGKLAPATPSQDAQHLLSGPRAMLGAPPQAPSRHFDMGSKEIDSDDGLPQAVAAEVTRATRFATPALSSKRRGAAWHSADC